MKVLTTTLRSLLAVVVVATTAVFAVGCSKDETTAVDSTTTTTAKASTSVITAAPNYDGLVETLTKMGISETQARCVVDKMDKASHDIGDASTPADKTRIEKLLEECKITG